VFVIKTQPFVSFDVPAAAFSPTDIFSVPDRKSNPLSQFITIVPLVSLRFLLLRVFNAELLEKLDPLLLF
jgi:hypothetical protein